MKSDIDWQPRRSTREKRFGGAGMGALRVALLFGSAAVALALLALPLIDEQDRSVTRMARGIDPLTTSASGQRDRSSDDLRGTVLQLAP